MSTDRIKRHLEAFVIGLLRPIDWYASYACKVQSQNSDGSLELRPEDSRLADYSKVPVHYGIPETTATFQQGARVVMAFENGDRSQPYVYAFDTSVLTELKIGGTGAQLVALSNLVNDGFAGLRSDINSGFSTCRTEATLISAHVHPAGTPSTGASPTLGSLAGPTDVGEVGDVACEKVKVK